MQPRKGLPLALEALAETKDLNARLFIAGDGEMRGDWERYAKRLNLGGKVEFLGQVPWNEMSRLYQSADAFLFTSLRDSFGSQVLEAMAHSLPILTLDHQGVGTFVLSDAGIKVPVTSPRQTAAEIAKGIRRLASCPEERLKMGEAAHAYARTQRGKGVPRAYLSYMKKRSGAPPVNRQAHRADETRRVTTKG